MTLALKVRTPNGLLLDADVKRVIAEDLDGWFGIAPGRVDLVAALPPGLLIYRDEEGEGFVALEGGLLDLRSGECRVMARNALLTRDLAQVAARVDELVQSREDRRRSAAGVLNELVREAMNRLARGMR